VSHSSSSSSSSLSSSSSSTKLFSLTFDSSPVNSKPRIFQITVARFSHDEELLWTG